MRDIRGDLQDRAGFLEEQIGAAQAQFEKRMELFTREHESKIADLQAELEAVNMLMEREYRRIMSAPDLEEERRQAQSLPEPETVAVALEDFDEPDYEDDQPQRVAEDEGYRAPLPADPEPAPEATSAADERPARRHSEPPYAARSVAREEVDHPQQATSEVRARRPIPTERSEAERRPVQTSQYRPDTRAREARQDLPQRSEQPQRYAPESGPSVSQKQPLADFLIRKLGEAGTMTLDDMCGVAVREGYFAEGENPDRTVQMTLANVVKAGFIRQMPNGTFAPASVMDTIRLRRAI